MYLYSAWSRHPPSEVPAVSPPTPLRNKRALLIIVKLLQSTAEKVQALIALVSKMGRAAARPAQENSPPGKGKVVEEDMRRRTWTGAPWMAKFQHLQVIQYTRLRVECLGVQFHAALTAGLRLNVTICMGNNSCVADVALRASRRFFA